MGYYNNDKFCDLIIKMKSKLLLSLIKSIIQLNKLELKNIDEISSFVNSQINKMPDYFSISVKIISYFFEFIIFFTHFKRFHNLTQIRKVKSLLFIKKKRYFFNLKLI